MNSRVLFCTNETGDTKVLAGSGNFCKVFDTLF